MALQTFIRVDVEKEGNSFTFTMPVGVKLQDCYDASVEVTKQIVDFSKKMEEQQAAAKEESAETEVKSESDPSD